MTHLTLLTVAVACGCLGLDARASADPDIAANSQYLKSATLANPAETCRTAVRAFNLQMGKDGYWLGGSGFQYGYPMGESGYGQGYDHAAADEPGYRNARPGYEIRILLASANILAQNGLEQGCEDVLDTIHTIYRRYVADMHGGGSSTADEPGWQQKEIAAARPVTAGHIAYRPDELLDTAVRSSSNETLGSVQDLVMSPKTGKITYLVIARGGLFGIDKKYVPIPWSDFKTTEGVSFLVLDTSRAAMDTAPEVSRDQMLTHAQFDQRSLEVDAYWKTHLSN